ncbi:MAG: CtsR family transcriptional regulator [Clostridia bacterium]|jgi:transcriptional regulator CtsR|nr:CtsR family transcriptional regulator [Clostridia bacterium]MDD4145910.1 CtsR family transcriptional regulator [Clostridia bacterium]MDD4665991.1 CtsR family transcriptional regulator [Clostridia bacterium]
MSLVRRIEEYLKSLLTHQEAIEIQRNELAEFFNCVPSQINYVLSTRFTPIQGYLVESRRGGGGYVRIIKISWDAFPHYVLKNVYKEIEPSLEQGEAEGVLKRFYEEQLITTREYNLLKAIINRETLALDLPERDIIRAKIMQVVLTTLCRKD